MATSATFRRRLDGAATETVIEARPVSLPARAREVWQARRLLGFLAGQAVRNRYKKTALGWLWLIIRPVIPVMISTLVFSEMAGINPGPMPYFLFVLVGSTVWYLFEEGLIWCTRSIQMHRRLLTKLYFPRIIVVPASVAPAFVEFGIHLLLIFAAGSYYLATAGDSYLSLGPRTPLAILGVIFILCIMFGVGLFTAVLGAETRDTRFTLRYILRFWFFLTPVVYPTSLIPEQWRWVAIVNPVTPGVELFKAGLLGAPLELGVLQMLGSALVVLVVLAVGLWYFNAAEAEAVDRI